MAEYDPMEPPVFDASNEEYDTSALLSHGDEDEDDDYDPSSFNFASGNEQQQTPSASASTQPSQAPSRTASAAPAQTEPPKKAGGFIIEEESDEEQDAGIPVPSQRNGNEGSHAGLGAIAQSEVQDVNLSSEPQDAAAVPTSTSNALNGSTATAATAFQAPVSTTAASTTATTSFPSLPANTESVAMEGKPVSTTPNPAVNGTPAPGSAAGSTAGSVRPQAQQLGAVPPTPASQRLPHDKVGQLEDRIREDPRADTDAWLILIAHYKEKGQLDNVRKTYERLFQVLPNVASVWYDYAKMEWDQNDFPRLEQVLNASLPRVPNVRMWSFYLDYLRRIHPLQNDASGQARAIITQAFDAVLDTVGIDPDAGSLWRDYIDFVKSGPGVVGGTGWQDAQKMDLLRKAYGKACSLPQNELVRLWKEYDNFELGINKATGRKFLQEKSPAYMTAKTAKTQLDHKIAYLRRDGMPLLPPLRGCEGRAEWDTQVVLWKGWVAWEMEDPLVLKDEDLAAYKKRILYVWKQATMVMRFAPDLWFEAAQWCFEQATEEFTQQGEQFLDQGSEANPESVLLALRKADRIETGLSASDDEAVTVRNGEVLDVPFEKCHAALYQLHKNGQMREKQIIAKIQEHFASLPPEDEILQQDDDDDDDESEKEKKLSREEQMQQQIKQLKDANATHMDALKRTISYVWVAKMQAFRRVQGQGKPNQAKKGFRGVFAEARPRGQLTSDVYIASALMEYHCYKDPSATRIFERGLKLFPADEIFALEYIKHLISANDVVNARAVFETTVTKILGQASLAEEKRKLKCLPLFDFMHGFEGKYGDLALIHRLEKRMREMYDGSGDMGEGDMARLAGRTGLPSFDARKAELVISPTQIRPLATAPGTILPIPSIEAPLASSPRVGELALGPSGPYIAGASPKRALDDSDTENTPRKFMRAESPLKGTPSMRIASLANTNNKNGSVSVALGAGGFMTKTYVPGTAPQLAVPVPAGPPPLPQHVTWLLSAIPGARHYQASHFDPNKMVEFIRNVDLGRANIR